MIISLGYIYPWEIIWSKEMKPLSDETGCIRGGMAIAMKPFSKCATGDHISLQSVPVHVATSDK